MGEYETLLYDVEGAIASITLNRPEALNTIVPPMTDELEAAVHEATDDRAVKVIVLRGAGRSFCGGFNFGGGFHFWDDTLTTDGKWDPGKEFIATTSPTSGWVPKFMSLWRTPEAGDRAGARLVRRRRQRDGALRRHRDHERGRADRHAVLADVGLPPRGHVGGPARASPTPRSWR